MNELIYQLVMGCAGVIITICATFVTRRFTAWLKEKELLDEVEKAVYYAEQLCKAEKITLDGRKDAAVSFLKSRGIEIDENILDMLIESVVGGINIALGKTATQK